MDMVKQQSFVFGYGRASTEKQRLSPERQKEVCEEWFSRQRFNGLEKFGWGGWFVDPAVSATIPWFQRPAGSELIQRIKQGDIIVVTEYDRAIRGPSDSETVAWALREIGVKPIFLDIPGLDIETNSGELIFGMMSVVKRFEKREVSRRTSEAAKFRKKTGRPVSGHVPWGWTKCSNGITKWFEPSIPERKLGKEIQRMKDVLKMSVRGKILPELIRKNIPHPRPTYTINGNITPNLGRITKYCVFELLYAARKGFPLPGLDPEYEEHRLRSAITARKSATHILTSKGPHSMFEERKRTMNE